MSQSELKPFAIEFADGYYAVKQCTDADHAAKVASVEHPHRQVVKIEEVR